MSKYSVSLKCHINVSYFTVTITGQSNCLHDIITAATPAGLKTLHVLGNTFLYQIENSLKNCSLIYFWLCWVFVAVRAFL